MNVRLSTARTIMVGPVLDSDGVAKTNLAVGAILISKNGGNPAALNGSATLTHKQTGHYLLLLTANDISALGVAELSIDSTTDAMPIVHLNVVTAAAWDALHASSGGYIPSNLKRISDGAGAADNAEKYFDGTGYGVILQRTTIASLSSQTSFTISAGSTDNDAYNGCVMVIEDSSTAAQKAVSLVIDYNGGDKTITLAKDPGIFTMANGDIVTILASATAATVWDRVLTGATHNIASSAGRRLRGVQAFGDYANGALWFDSENGVGGQVSYENATVQNPSNSLTDILAIAISLKMVRIQVAPGSTLTLGASIDGFSVMGEGWTLDLSDESVSGSFFHGAVVSGAGTGGNPPHFHECHIGTTSLPPSHFTKCGFGGVLTLTGAGDYFLDGCHAAVLLPALDFEDAAENKNVFLTDYGGDVEIRNLGQAGSTDVFHLDGNGKLVIASTCEAATIEIQGNIEIEDNVAGGFVAGASGTLNDDARIDVDQVTAEAAAALSTHDGKLDTAQADLDIITGGDGVFLATSSQPAGWPANLAASAGQVIKATVDTATNTHTPTATVFQADDITEATGDHYNGRIVIFTSGNLAGQATDITDYTAVGGIGQFTVTALTEAPANDDTFVIV